MLATRPIFFSSFCDSTSKIALFAGKNGGAVFLIPHCLVDIYLDRRFRLWPENHGQCKKSTCIAKDLFLGVMTNGMEGVEDVYAGVNMYDQGAILFCFVVRT